MIKRYLYIIAVFALVAGNAFVVGNAYANERPVIVELFTSQGCAACPPASSLVSRLAMEDENIVPFIWAVDYWDYLGWQDTMAIEGGVERQEDFNRSMEKNGVFTPQVIINGAVQTIGSREGDIRTLIKEQTEADVAMLDVGLKGGLENLSLNIGGIKASSGEAVVTLIWFKDRETVRIASGDNRGKLFHYTNVVRGVHNLGTLNTMAPNQQSFLSIPIGFDALEMLDANCIAIMVQESVGGKIIGFTKITLDELANRP